MDGVSVKLQNDYILISAKGICDNFEYMVQGTQLLHKAVVTYGKSKALLDYRKLKLDLPMADAFNLVKVYENDFPDLSDVIICVVCNKESLELIKFWESVSAKRGYISKVFTNFEKGEKWILSNVEESSKLH